MLKIMSTQTVTIQVDPQTAQTLQSLQEKAEAQGVSLDYLLRSVFETPNGNKEKPPFYETATTEEWLKAFNDWAKSHRPNTPGLTLEDVSRESIYEDR